MRVCHIFKQIHTFFISRSFFDSRYEFSFSKFCIIFKFCQNCSTLRPFYLFKGSRNEKMNCQTLVDTFRANSNTLRFAKYCASRTGQDNVGAEVTLSEPGVCCGFCFKWSADKKMAKVKAKNKVKYIACALACFAWWMKDCLWFALLCLGIFFLVLLKRKGLILA